MIDIFASRLAECLEALQRGELNVQDCLQKYPQDSEELEKLLNLAFLLENTPVQSPDIHFERDARARILNSASNFQKDGLIPRVKSILSGVFTLPTQPVMKFGFLAIILVVLLGSGLVFASAKAMPGDFLYPFKIFLEDARLMITGDEKETDLQIDLASERVREVDRLVQAQHYEDIEGVVERYVKHIDKITESITLAPSDKDKLKDVKSELILSNLEYHLEILYGLMEKVPEQSQPAIEKAIEASSKNKEKLQELFPDGMPGRGPKENDGTGESPQGSYVPESIDPQTPGDLELPGNVPGDRDRP
jgi:hypothetical protein